jgi:hypothetical protein
VTTPTLLTPGKTGGLKTRKASEIKAKPSVMIYGGSGIGKSTLAASAIDVPELSPVLHLNIENGMSEFVAERHPDVDVLDIDTFADLQKAFDYLNKTRNNDAGTVGEGWRTVILDNLTESQKQGMAHMFPGGGAPKFDDVLTGSWGDGTWNKNSEQMRVLIRAFRQLPVYSIFVAWERDLSKPDTPLQELVPSFSPSFAKEAPGMLNDVFYYHFNKAGERALETARSKTWTAKDRSGKLPATIVNPTMQTLFDYWSGRLVAEKTQSETPKNATMAVRPRK